MLETYVITGILGNKRLEAELVKFLCLEFVKAEPHRAVRPSPRQQQQAGKLFTFNMFAADVQSSIIKNNAIVEIYPPNLGYYRCFSSI